MTKTDQAKQPKLQPPATYKKVPVKTQVSTANRTEVKHCDISGPPSFDPYARGASTTGDYYSAVSSQMSNDMKTASGNTEYQTAVSSMLGTERPALSYCNDQLRPLASSTQRKATSRRNLNTATVVEPAKDSTPNPIYNQTLAEAITTPMSKGLEPLLAVKETKNKPTKYRGTRDGIVDGWLMLMKRYLQKAHAKDTPLDKAWTIVEFLENEARDYVTNKSEAERDTDEKVFALLARRFGTGSNKIQIQQQFRTRNQTPDEDYMQYLDALEGLRSQGFPNEEVAVRRYKIMQRFIEGVRSFELKRNLALMYAQEQYVDTPPNGRSPTIHGTTVPAHAWFSPFGKLSCTTATTTTATCRSKPTKSDAGTGPASACCPTPPTTTCGFQTTTAANMLQLRRPLALCSRLSFEGSSTETSTTSSQLMSHEPSRRVGVPIEPTRHE